ncbi:MAG TPA: hypothetical protein VIH09_05015 [Flavobacterium sp.]|uniref:hypothetical protein n=1 Tax=Flavobacterium sp. TaxID=239 RepID=UPI002F41674C
MKKILCLMTAFLFVLSSCSENEKVDIPDVNSSLLLKRMIVTDEDGSSFTLNYTYNGNQLVAITDSEGEGTIYWTYDQDMITKMEIKLSDGLVFQRNTYTYDANKRLVGFVRVDPEYNEGFREEYTYNSDNTIAVKAYSGDDNTQTIFDGTATITFADGEVAEYVSTYGVDYSYTYDTKNNPAKNILGLNKISFIDGEASGILHNIISTSVENNVQSTSVFTYNSQDYPLTEVATDSNGKTSTQFFYD